MAETAATTAAGRSFLAGHSEMARRIRDHDWTSHPFGPPETWPQSLRSALSICLHSAFPTAIYWGPDLRLLYNDAWSAIPGPRHPACLGAPAREVWSDIWHVIGPQFQRLLETGEGVVAENQMLPMRRYGILEETYWTYSFTPIRGEAGQIAGIFNSGHEMTETVLSQRRMSLVLDLGRALRGAPDARAAQRTAASMLGRRLDADRAGFCEVASDGETITIVEEWVSDRLSPIGHSARLSDFGPHIGRTLLSGQAVRIDDTLSDPDVRDPRSRATLDRLGARSLLAVPQTEAGRFVAAVYIHYQDRHRWTDHDEVTARQVLDWTWASVQRERTAEREALMMREIDHRAKNALAVAQGIIRLTSSRTLDGFREKVEHRVAALARTHALLAEARWQALDLRALVAEEMAPFGSAAAVRVDGPSVDLAPDLAQSLALILHELATNAVKHGALAAPGGALDVSWSLAGDGDLLLDWVERRPTTARQPDETSRKGFGESLLATVLEQQLGGEATRTWTPNGLHRRLRLPLRAPRPGTASAPVSPPEPRQPVVLLAEDEAIVAMDLEDRLRSWGYAVMGPFASEAAALAALDAALPDLAVLDLNLQGTLSYRIASVLRRQGVPVVFASGYDDTGGTPPDLADAPRVSKPYSDGQLKAAVARATGRAPGGL